ncbi:glycoside hydrolase family 18 protein [Aulographum hederae CBS 113979]|uniref:Glycoside hydrolase family 18 protein n=1 Tax=Aulographum hederae CBS 113979 TaxID=1176131 RepID=A0A6G1GIF7_9PEZI|nr:glycoside hydrolase family 18 protein [Aulographum hederae CBS 113979]
MNNPTPTPSISAHTRALLPLPQGPRLIAYAQTHHQNDVPVSLLPLVIRETGITHVIVAAIHVNEGPGNITLNDHKPDDPRFATLWMEVAWLQGAGVKVLGMLGGAAQGSFGRLSGGDEEFEQYYLPLKSLITTQALNGLDLDIEEPVLHPPIKRLILRLRADFGPSFLITLAPVAPALLPLFPHLSGPDFSYFSLESDPQTRDAISWYNVQFYCGWGDAGTAWLYEAIVAAGWRPGRCVMGVVTNPANGSGHVETERLCGVLEYLRRRFGDGDEMGLAGSGFGGFGGVMGWEYLNSGLERSGETEPWRWVQRLGRSVRGVLEPVVMPPFPALPDVPVYQPAAEGQPVVGNATQQQISAPPPAAVPWTADRVRAILGGNQTEAQGEVPAQQQSTVQMPEESKIVALVQMGFERDIAINALVATEGNLDMAVEMLL